MRFPPFLKSEAEKEVYVLIDKFYKKLPKNEDGSIKEIGDFSDNDIDALRHSYVSGVFLHEYGEKGAEIFGNLNELYPGGSSSPNDAQSKNMDYWNNAAGRKYGKKTSSRKKLFKLLLEALKRGELIIDPDGDKRVYEGKTSNPESLKDQVIVIKETKKGKNILYYDFANQIFLTRDDFVLRIKTGQYPKYEIRIVNREEIPVSKKDSTGSNNLG